MTYSSHQCCQGLASLVTDISCFWPNSSSCTEPVNASLRFPRKLFLLVEQPASYEPVCGHVEFQNTATSVQLTIHPRLISDRSEFSARQTAEILQKKNINEVLILVRWPQTIVITVCCTFSALHRSSFDNF